MQPDDDLGGSVRAFRQAEGAGSIRAPGWADVDRLRGGRDAGLVTAGRSHVSGSGIGPRSR
jgi:hypothetical protein